MLLGNDWNQNIHSNDIYIVRIKLLKASHKITDLEFIINLMVF